MKGIEWLTSLFTKAGIDPQAELGADFQASESKPALEPTGAPVTMTAAPDPALLVALDDAKTRIVELEEKNRQSEVNAYLDRLNMAGVLSSAAKPYAAAVLAVAERPKIITFSRERNQTEIVEMSRAEALAELLRVNRTVTFGEEGLAANDPPGENLGDPKDIAADVVKGMGVNTWEGGN